jgi:hypothetical protein
MAWTGHVNHVEVAQPDRPIQVNIDEVQARSRAPMAQQSWFDVFELQRFAQQRVIEQIDLANRKVVGGAKVGVYETTLAGPAGQ